MAAVPTLPTFGPGVLTTTQLSQLNTATSFLRDPPRAQLRQTVAQALTTGIAAAVTFTTEDYDTAGAHDTGTNPSRYTSAYPGRYEVSGAAAFAFHATGRRSTKWQINGIDVPGSQISLPATAASVCAVPARTMEVYLDVGDYLELIAIQESGTTPLNTAVTTSDQSLMRVRWVALS